MDKESKPYRYFDTPDGEDVPKKLWSIMRPTALSAIGIATADIMLYSKPKTYGGVMGRYIFIAGPIMGLVSTFVLTTNLTANIRKKDDQTNWILGGMTTGGLFGVWAKSTPIGVTAAVIFGFMAALKKQSVQEGWFLQPYKVQAAPGALRSVRQDWTLTAERPQNWTTGNE